MTDVHVTDADLAHRPWDAASVLQSPEECAAYLALALQRDSGDGAATLAALETVLRVKAMTERASAAGLHRSTLYRALQPGAKPSFTTVFRIVRALGLDLLAAPRTAETKQHAA